MTFKKLNIFTLVILTPWGAAAINVRRVRYSARVVSRENWQFFTKYLTICDLCANQSNDIAECHFVVTESVSILYETYERNSRFETTVGQYTDKVAEVSGMCCRECTLVKDRPMSDFTV